MDHWITDSIFYHIYPLGFCGAPGNNDFYSSPCERLKKVEQWIPHLKDLGISAVYLGPLFEATSHGYDTADFFWVDRRLGTNDTLKDVIGKLHDAGIKVVLDGVFHHVGRDFWAFKDLLTNRQESNYRDWFAGVDFSRNSPMGDSFYYDPWEGHYNLVKLNLSHPPVRHHLLQAVEMWIKEFGIDGLRLDVAYSVDSGFLSELRSLVDRLKNDFWLLGEMIHGDYNRLLGKELLHSVTNYECYKSLYSSHKDENYFELAWSLNRLFGENGLYEGSFLYNFADNHDVERVASKLTEEAHLYPLYALLFTMPGIPSIYYGSEWGIKGRKRGGDDALLRPALELDDLSFHSSPRLVDTIRRLSTIRRNSPALKKGNYRELYKSSQQFVFARQFYDDYTVVAVNSNDEPVEVDIPVADSGSGRFFDLLEPDECYVVKSGRIKLKLWSRWAKILKSSPF